MAGTTKTSDPKNHVEEVDHNLEEQTNEGPKAQDFPPLFEDESKSLSEEDLTGDEKTPKSEEKAATSPSKGDENPPKEKAPEEEKDEPKEKEGAVEKKIDEKPKSEPVDDDKPPEGFVPHGALHEERIKRQHLSGENETLRAEIAELKSTPKAPKDGDFKVLSDAEFQELLEEDPTEAILYDRRLRVHEAGEAREADVQRTEEAIINQSTQAMREAVPQIYDPDSTINDDLSRFAVEQGFDEQSLPVLTDPRTKIIPPGSNEPVLLGNVAVGQVKMLYNLYKRGDNSDRAAIEKEVTERVTKEVTDKVTKEIMAKFNATPSLEYHSLGDIPGSGDEPFDVSKNLTEKQIDNLSEAQRRRYLGG